MLATSSVLSTIMWLCVLAATVHCVSRLPILSPVYKALVKAGGRFDRRCAGKSKWVPSFCGKMLSYLAFTMLVISLYYFGRVLYAQFYWMTMFSGVVLVCGCAVRRMKVLPKPLSMFGRGRPS